jgi:flagellar motility protein MotE (MotC chaperone)
MLALLALAGAGLVLVGAPSAMAEKAAVTAPAAPAAGKTVAPSEKPPSAPSEKTPSAPSEKMPSAASEKPPSTETEKASPVETGKSASAAAPPAAAAPAAAKKPAYKHEEAPAHEAPPISITSLRDEIRRSSDHDKQAVSGTEREKMERLAADINKAREALRQDTARLETMLAKKETAAAVSNPSNGPSELPEGAKKPPTSLDGLAKAMRGMKPEQAAPIISRLERKTAADVLQRMPATDAGKVMGQCKPEVAAELATEIASRTPRSELRR